MNTYIIHYNKKWKTSGRKHVTRTTYGLTQEMVAPSADVARDEFLAELTNRAKVSPWTISRDITKIEEAI